MKTEIVRSVLDLLIDQLINDKELHVPDNATQDDKDTAALINQTVVAIKEHFGERN